MHPSRASGWTWHPSLTHSQMSKQSVQMVSSWQASNLDWSHHSSEQMELGSMSCLLCFGVCGPHPTIQLDSLLSSSYTVLRQSFPMILSLTNLVAPCIRRQ